MKYGRVIVVAVNSATDGAYFLISEYAVFGPSPMCRRNASSTHARHRRFSSCVTASGGNADRSSVSILCAAFFRLAGAATFRAEARFTTVFDGALGLRTGRFAGLALATGFRGATCLETPFFFADPAAFFAILQTDDNTR